MNEISDEAKSAYQRAQTDNTYRESVLATALRDMLARAMKVEHEWHCEHAAKVENFMCAMCQRTLRDWQAEAHAILMGEKGEGT